MNVGGFLWQDDQSVSTSGSVPVGADCRISWMVMDSKIMWGVAGREKRTVLRLGLGMCGLLGRDGECVERDVSHDAGMWVVRGWCGLEFELLERLENFMILATSGE
jgi:hypothetical protein